MSTELSKTVKVAHVESTSRVVLNAGSNDGIQVGRKAVLYTLGEEIFDPDTKESLGRLEIIKGEGKILHIQDRISTLRGYKFTKKITRPQTAIAILTGSFSTEEEQELEIDFANPSVGDIVRFT